MRLRLFLLFAFPILLLVSASCEQKTETPGTGNSAPYISHLYYPYHNSTNQSRTPYFSWKAIDPDGDALTYELSLEKDAVEIFNSGTVADTFLYYGETLDENTLYQWKITASDGELSTTSNLYNFTTGTGTNNPPYKPYNMNPHGSYHPVDVTLQWECLDPDGDPLTFDVWLGTSSPSLTRISMGQSDAYFAVSSLDVETRYIWQIDAFDSHGASSSRMTDFVTQLAGMPNPAFDPNPADGRSDVPVDTVLSWSGSHPEGLPLTYDVYFGPTGSPPPAVSTGQSDSTFTPPTMQYNTTYHWSVTSEDQHLHRTDGPLWSFTTEAGVQPLDGIYAQLILGRRQTYSEFDHTLTRNDWIMARFDSAYAPDGPITPLRSSSVICGTPTGFDIPWVEGMDMHYYNDIINGYFLTTGVEYTYTIKEGPGVPALEEAITLPSCTPYIISPEGFSYVPRTGFNLEWNGSCGGTVAITIIDLGAIDSTGIYIVTEDDGAHTITADDLSVLDSFVYQIQVVLITENRHAIAATGYDPRSFISARILSSQLLYLDQ